MPMFRKKPVEVEADQWHKNGDHPFDYADDIRDPVKNADGMEVVWTSQHRRENNWEGQVVRYFRRPESEYAGGVEHELCGRTWHEHGWINTLEGGHTVCPADWIITGVKGERYPCKPDIFGMTYDLLVPTVVAQSVGVVDGTAQGSGPHGGHYGGANNPYEVIKVLEAWGLTSHSYLWTAVKYIARCEKKGTPIEDLEKARFYLDREIANRKANV